MKKFRGSVKIQKVFFDKESNGISIHRNKSNRLIFTENYEVNNTCKLIQYLQPERTNIEDNAVIGTFKNFCNIPAVVGRCYSLSTVDNCSEMETSLVLSLLP